jgi:hypothetical protein
MYKREERKPIKYWGTLLLKPEAKQLKARLRGDGLVIGQSKPAPERAPHSSIMKIESILSQTAEDNPTPLAVGSGTSKAVVHTKKMPMPPSLDRAPLPMEKPRAMMDLPEAPKKRVYKKKTPSS